MAVKVGDRIKVEYSGKTADGTEFDSSERMGKPLEFEVGAGQMIEGFEEAVVGMELEETKTVMLEPGKAYGSRDERLVQEVPRAQLPPKEVEEGMMVLMRAKNGMELPAIINSVGEETVALDFNHPLAGEELTFDIKLIEIVPSQAQ